MKIIIYVIGVFFTAAGFVDGPNPIPLLIGVVLLILGWKFDDITGGLVSKNATQKLMKLADLRDRGIITDKEYEHKSRGLKSKL